VALVVALMACHSPLSKCDDQDASHRGLMADCPSTAAGKRDFLRSALVDAAWRTHTSWF